MTQKHDDGSNALTATMTSLLAARDEMRLHAHLLGMDAREKWDRIEKAIFDLETSVGSGAETISEDFIDAVHEFTDTVKGFVAQHVHFNPGAG
ncbi:MAG TPA: hypothetical protein VHE30_13475 [Polyangiaceae bacterium]|nr:hypothetical protein [Polyangiaceae bacterium]